jgi:hypothetical protein
MNGMRYFQMGKTDEARTYLANAYAIDGEALFEGEDPECLKLVLSGST